MGDGGAVARRFLLIVDRDEAVVESLALRRGVS